MEVGSLYRIDTGFHPFGEPPRPGGWLDVGEGHEIWWEETGPVEGAPVLVVHGGPGGEIRPNHRRLLDPNRHRGVFFEQRGCGRSRPFGGFEANDTWRSVADMERLRRHLGLERWAVLGGSWGSSLALAYAETHPDRASALIVSGVFLCRAEDIHWWWEGARTVFPEVYAARDAFLSEAERGDPRAAFHERIANPDPAISDPAAALLAHVEAQTLDLWPQPPPEQPDLLDPKSVAAARMFAWYDRHDFFFADGQLLRDSGHLASVPGAIVAGRCDMCTPPKGAWDLAQAWPKARLTIVPAAGHRWADEMLGATVVREVARLV